MRNFLVLMLAVATTLLTMSCEPPKLAVGGFHACGISGGEVYCWGRNSSGQSGQSNTGDISTPTAIADPVGYFDDPIGVWTGKYHSCAQNDNGSGQSDRLRCWGNNSWGQIGNGTSGNAYIPVWAPDNAISVGLGDYHSAVVDSLNYLYVTGDNAYHQLGIYGSTSDKNTWTEVIFKGTMGSNLNLWPIKVATGKNHTCIISDPYGNSWGYVWCTGNNNFNQASSGSNSTINGWRNTQVYAKEVYAGGDTTCAKTTAGVLSCWGKNAGGFNNGATSSPTITQTFAGLSINKVIINQNNVCVLDDTLRLRCAGLGYSPTYTAALVSAGVGDAAAGGTKQMCFGTSDAEAHCWGYNSDRQLGDGTTTTYNAPNYTTTQ